VSNKGGKDSEKNTPSSVLVYIPGCQKIFNLVSHRVPSSGVKSQSVEGGGSKAPLNVRRGVNSAPKTMGKVGMGKPQARRPKKKTLHFRFKKGKKNDVDK